MKYTIVDPRSGEILRSGIMSSGPIQLQAGPGQIVFAETFDDEEHIMDGNTGDIRRKTVEEKRAKIDELRDRARASPLGEKPELGLSVEGMPGPSFAPPVPVTDGDGW